MQSANCRMQNGAECAGGREVRIRSLDRPSLSSSRAYLPQQAAGRIRAEGWVLGKAISGVGSRNETTYGLTPFRIDPFHGKANFWTNVTPYELTPWLTPWQPLACSTGAFLFFDGGVLFDPP